MSQMKELTRDLFFVVGLS